MPPREKNMSEFARGILPNNLASLRHLAEKPGTNWWKDLLKLWRPSGLTAGDHGLRLAVRNNYLNLYRRGQSVACVRFSKAHEPYVRTHVKYAFPEGTGQHYVKMRNGTNIRDPKTHEPLSYEGASTLRTWIERADKHKGPEKTCVDELIATNPSIIDVEMGLPASGDRKTAQRMDCVALEREGDGIRIVFWEAKMIDDARLRSESMPEVTCQLKIYRNYLAVDDHARSVENAYQTVCQLLKDMHDMAAHFSDQPALDPLVIAASKESSLLKVDPTPRLVIFGGKQYQKKGNWDIHLKRLKAEEISCLVLSIEPYCLHRPEAGV
jgi:hypothetical protein